MRLQSCPEQGQLHQLVHGELDHETEFEIELHVTQCNLCRARIEQEIQEAEWWQHARNTLQSSRANGDCEQSPHSHLLSLLGPTDDPHKMGRIAEYEVMAVIGRGGMGVVFKAFDPRLNRFVAIKMLLPHLATSSAARKRFAREGQAAAAVVDDFVLPIYTVAEWNSIPYLVTQLSRGTTLQRRVQDHGPLEAREILRIGMQTARGLAAAHAQGLVHRDVKPSNILMDGNVDRVMLTDFGLARAIDDASITSTGLIAGTPQYMSPEQIQGRLLDPRSDLFSLGCVLYFLCTARPPFRADNSYATIRCVTDDEPHPIRNVNPDIPAWLCTIVQKLMKKRPEDRYGSALEVAELLAACLAHLSNPLEIPLPLAVRSPDSLRRPVFELHIFKVAGFLAMIIITLFVAFAWSLFGNNGTAENQNEEGLQQQLTLVLREEANPSGANAGRSEPSVSDLLGPRQFITGIPSIERLKSDLKLLLELTSPEEQRQWANVEDYIETLTIGIDDSRPIGIQHASLIGNGSTLIWVPLEDQLQPFRRLRQNLESLGYRIEEADAGAATFDLYQLSQLNEHGWVRVESSGELACVAVTTGVEALDALRQQVISAKPATGNTDYSMSISMVNEDHSADAQEYRRRAFQSYRDQTVIGIASDRNSASTSPLRKWFVPVWLDEYQLLSAEGSSMSARVKLDATETDTPTALVDFKAAAIPGTALASSILKLASANDAFKDMPHGESPVLLLRLNLSISKLRIDKLQMLSRAVSSDLKGAIQTEMRTTGEKYNAVQTLSETVQYLLSDMAASGQINAFVEGNVVENQPQWIAAIVTPNPQRVTELLTAITQIDPANTVEWHVAETETAAVHSIQIRDKVLACLQRYFKTDGNFFVAVDVDKIWIASGHNASDLLRQRLNFSGQPGPSTDVLQLDMAFPILVDELLNVENAPTPENRFPFQSQILYLRSCSKNVTDRIRLEVNALPTHVEAKARCDAGVLRLLGREVATFSRENLQ